MNSFRTEIIPVFQPLDFTLRSKVMLVGSCFSDNIGGKFVNARFESLINPHGILFNPLSVVRSLDDYLTEKQYGIEDLTSRGKEFVSLNHHGSFADSNAQTLLEKINENIQRGAKFLKKTDFLILTLGTAWTYFYEKTDNPVANCHKLPQHEFVKKLLEVDLITKALTAAFETVLLNNPNIKIILTVSPVRHWKDGVVENSLSKSHLLVAVNNLVKKFSCASYFPAYELMLDDLRDYRFYNHDMLHPSPLAVDYIWQKFQSAFFDKMTVDKVIKIEKLAQVFNHRPSNKEKHQLAMDRADQSIKNILNS